MIGMGAVHLGTGDIFMTDPIYLMNELKIILQIEKSKISTRRKPDLSAKNSTQE